ncbi:hypothetical protein GF352_04935 [archaeon]|nr:hypothetical protein [archaeon]
MNPSVPSVIIIIAPGGFRDEELFETKELLEKEVTVEIASKTTEEVTGMLGGKIKPDRLINTIDTDDVDAIVFIGGSGVIKYFNDEAVLRITSLAYEKGVLLAAICIAPSILANAGVLEGVKATSFPSEKDNLQSKGAIYTDEGVTRDKKVITAKGPDFTKEFAREIIKALH